MSKILVIDDDPDVLEYLRVRLQTHGYDVAAASGGYAALSLCETYKPDLLIVDLVMNDMSGFEVSARVKERFPGIKTLFISGYTGMEYLRQASKSTLDVPFLQKPFELAAL